MLVITVLEALLTAFCLGVWVPLSRLTFMAYLCHPIVLDLMFGNLRFELIYTDWMMACLFPAAVLLSYSLGLALAVVVNFL